MNKIFANIYYEIIFDMFQLILADLSAYFFPPNFREHQDSFVVELINHRDDSHHDGPLVDADMLYAYNCALSLSNKQLNKSSQAVIFADISFLS